MDEFSKISGETLLSVETWWSITMRLPVLM